jgi:hypothetical protein
MHCDTWENTSRIFTIPTLPRRAIVQEVSRQLLIAETRVRSKIRSYGILGVVFSEYFEFLHQCSIFISKHIVTDLLRALLSNGSVNKHRQTVFYEVRAATVATQRRGRHLYGSYWTRNNRNHVRCFLCGWRGGYITRW